MMKDLKKTARLIGLGYLVIFITGFYANFFVLEGLVNDESAKETFMNILLNQQLFRMGILSFLLMVVTDVVLAWPLYLLLKPVNRNLSVLSSWLRLVNGTIFGVALVYLVNILMITNGNNLFSNEESILHAQTMIYLDSFNITWLIGLVFFGLHLLILGYLVFKSGYMPKVIGIFLILAGIGYLTDSFANFIMPNYEDYKSIFEMIVVIPGVLGEFSLTIWLLIKGVKNK